MYTEDSNSGFLGGLKSLFSSKKTGVIADGSTAVREDSLVEEYVPQRKAAVDAPTDRPMGTRTVDYSHEEIKQVKEDLEEAHEEMAFSHDQLNYHQELDIQFASMMIEKGGKFVYCETITEAVAELKNLSQEMNWSHVFCWENEVKEAFCTNNFQKGAIGFTIENSDAAMCLCESLIADMGSLLLNSKQASRRRLPVFPKVQIFLADTSQIAADLSKSIEVFQAKNKGELPSVLDLNDNVKGHYYHANKQLVLKAEGPSDVYVFLVDEKIEPSVRP